MKFQNLKIKCNTDFLIMVKLKFFLFNFNIQNFLNKKKFVFIEINHSQKKVIF